MPSYLRLDLFPATVIAPDGTKYDPCRAVVTDTELYVFVDSNPRPVKAFSEHIYDFQSTSRTRFIVTIDDDEQSEYIVSRRAGCGCGNKLRGFRPFPGIPLVRN